MYKQNKLIIILGLISLMGATLLIGTACKKFVQIGPPSTQLSATSTFTDNNAATAALTAIYSQMQNQTESWSMSQCSGLLSDELVSLSADDLIQPYYTNQLLATSSPVAGPWSRGYNYIYQANALIVGLNNNNLAPRIRNQLIGEAKFIRAFWYFYLVNCYGDVPLVTTTDYKINQNLRRATSNDVYQQIVADLKDAQNLLSPDYIDGSDTVVTNEKIRPNKWVATALLSRVYLYSKDYANAEIQSNSIINSGKYSISIGLDSVFLKNSAEAIWQLDIPSPYAYNTIDAYYFILVTPPLGFGFVNTVTISLNLLNAFEPGDLRKSAWLGTVTSTSPDTTYYFPYKYKSVSADEITEYTMVFRLAEQYLIHAESLVRQDKSIDQAISDIDTIRSRAGLSGYSGPKEKSALISGILHERQVEFFAEWGHRWFDLIRTDSINPVMNIVAPLKGGVWKPESALYPIPQSEINVDHNISQNIGY